MSSGVHRIFAGVTNARGPWDVALFFRDDL
jgi:hypothetical protein